MKKLIKKLFNWIFKEDLETLKTLINVYKTDLGVLKEEVSRARLFTTETKKRLDVFDKVLSGIDVSVDVHEYDNKYSPSWAVVSLQGQKTDYIKFMELGDADIRQISKILRDYERHSNIKVDASPMASKFLRVERRTI